MKKGATVLLLGAVLMASAALATEPAKTTTPATKAAAKAPAAAEQMAKGAITALDAAKKTVTVKGTAATWTFETSSTTTFYANKKAAAWGDLKVGQQVSVHFQTKGAQKTATKITVVG